MKLAEQYELDEQYEKAYTEYKKELPHKSGDIELLTKLAHLALILDNKEEAKVYYSKILEVDSANILAYEQLIDIFVDEDKFKYYLFRGNLHSLQQQFSHAKNDYKKAIDCAKTPLEALPARYLHAGLCEGQEKWQEAVDQYLRIADDDTNNYVAYLKLAELYEKTEDLSASVSILEKGLKEHRFKELEEPLAGYYIRNSQPEKAFGITKNEATKARALMDMGKNDAAFEILNKIKSQYEKEPLIYSLLAQYYFQKSEYDKAFKEIEQYEKLNPTSALIYQMRALIYEAKEDKFNEHLNWGRYNELRGNKEVALNEYMIAYQFDSQNADLIKTIASQLESLKDNTKACEFYEKLLDIEPNDVIALQKLANFRDEIGDYEMALEYIERLKKINPRNDYVRDNYETIKNHAENGGDFISFFKKIFGKRMGV